NADGELLLVPELGRLRICTELGRLDAHASALAAELREQQDSHQQRLNDLQGSRDELRAQFAELAGKIFDEREQRFAET
ncbi:homogentisate 1,2-dioxygenase, partial [Roseburia faecis]|nr:homogentisate 1,2-dioxygenase [Roseburia faecis]